MPGQSDCFVGFPHLKSWGEMVHSKARKGGSVYDNDHVSRPFILNALLMCRRFSGWPWSLRSVVSQAAADS